MTIRLTITQIGTPKQRQGTRGPFETNYLKAKEYNDKFLNFFVNKTTQGWRVGDVVEVEAVEEQQYTSKKDGSLQTSFNIKLPRFGGNADVMKALEEIRGQLTKIALGQREIYAELTKGKSEPDVIDGTDIPYPKSTGPTAFDEGGPEPLTDEELASMEAEAEKSFNEM